MASPGTSHRFRSAGVGIEKLSQAVEPSTDSGASLSSSESETQASDDASWDNGPQDQCSVATESDLPPPIFQTAAVNSCTHLKDLLSKPPGLDLPPPIFQTAAVSPCTHLKDLPSKPPGLDLPPHIFQTAAASPRTHLKDLPNKPPGIFLKAAYEEKATATKSQRLIVAGTGAYMESVLPLVEEDDICDDIMQATYMQPEFQQFLKSYLCGIQGELEIDDQESEPDEKQPVEKTENLEESIPMPCFVLLGQSTAPEESIQEVLSYPSVGSAGHPTECASACKFFKKARGCRDGAECQHCHLCEWHRPAAENTARRARKAARAASAAITANTTNAAAGQQPESRGAWEDLVLQ